MKFGRKISPRTVNARNIAAGVDVKLYKNSKAQSRRQSFASRYPWLGGPSGPQTEQKMIERIARRLIQYYRQYGRWPNKAARNWYKGRTFKRAMRRAKRIQNNA